MPQPKKQLEEVKNAGKFVLLLVIAFAVLFGITALFPPLFFEQITGQTSSLALNALGIGNALETREEVFIGIETGSKPIIGINDLCTGMLEGIILIAAILATFEINWKKRIAGAVAATLAVFVFNQIRILATVFSILNLPLDFVQLSHEVLFRVFLFITIAVLYALWIWWARGGLQFKKIKNFKSKSGARHGTQ